MQANSEPTLSAGDDGQDLARRIDEIGRPFVLEDLSAMESPTYSDDGNVHLLAGLDVPDLIADVDDLFLLQVELLQEVEEGPVFAEEVLFSVNEVEDIKVLGLEELLDVLPRVRGQDPQPDPPSFQVEDKS